MFLRLNLVLKLIYRYRKIFHMYKLPDNIDLTFLVDRELLQVCFGLNVLILKFDESVIINIESKCRYLPSIGPIVEIDKYSQCANIICILLGYKIVEVNGYQTGELYAKFSNGDTFIIYDDND